MLAGSTNLGCKSLSACSVLSDSGSPTEEASILGFPAVTLRDAHERPKGRDEAAIVMCGLGSKRVLQAIELVTGKHAETGPPLRPVGDYRPENVSRRVERIIFSYVDYVNANVWSRS